MHDEPTLDLSRPIRTVKRESPTGHYMPFLVDAEAVRRRTRAAQARYGLLTLADRREVERRLARAGK